MGSQMMVAQAMAKFQLYLTKNMNEPINLATIRQFAVMIKEVVDGMNWEPGDDLPGE